MVRQDKSKPGRVTPKGTGAASSAAGSSGAGSSGNATVGPSGVGRTPVNVDAPSSVIVPIVMFGALGIGTLIILFNYLTEDILGTPSNWYLLGGLGMILVGIIAATQYR